MSPPIDSQVDVEDSNNIEEQQHADLRTPLLDAAGLRPSSIPQIIGNLLQNWWLWEILSSFISVLSFVSIVVILIVYDSSSLPDWPFVFNVRSYSSFSIVLIRLKAFRSTQLYLFSRPSQSFPYHLLWVPQSVNPNGFGIDKKSHGHFRTCSFSMTLVEVLGAPPVFFSTYVLGELPELRRVQRKIGHHHVNPIFTGVWLYWVRFSRS